MEQNRNTTETGTTERALLDNSALKCDIQNCCCNKRGQEKQNSNPVDRLFPAIKICQFNPFSKNYIPIFHDSIAKNEDLQVVW